jgi:hypothetical protein
MPATQLSWQVRLATAVVGLGVVLGAGLIVLAFALMQGDPGFLFAILPIVFLFLSVAGVTIATFSLGFVVQLRRRAPGVRLQVALFGGSLVICGMFVATASRPAAVVLVLYGATLVWLMTTLAAANDLGSWTVPVARPRLFGLQGSGAAGADAPAPPPWWETWKAGMAQGMPGWEKVLVAAALLAFALGLVLLPLGLFLFPDLRQWAAFLIVLAIAVVGVMERRMKVRLGSR